MSSSHPPICNTAPQPTSGPIGRHRDLAGLAEASHATSDLRGFCCNATTLRVRGQVESLDSCRLALSGVVRWSFISGRSQE